jgi:hypothetical protein
MGAAPARGVQMNYKIDNDNVRVEYLDEDNFRFAVDSGLSTVILEGAIYLTVKVEGHPEKVYLIADRETRKSNKAKFQRSPFAALPPAASVEPVKDAPRALARAFPNALYVTEFRRAGALRATRVTSAENRSLAQVQRSIKQTMDSMDMSVCGGAVQSLVAWWVPEFVERGHAIISTNQGIEMRDAPRTLSNAPETWLPRDVKPIDYRVVSGNK